MVINLEQFSKPARVIAPIIDSWGNFKGRLFNLKTRDGWYKIELGDRAKVLREATDIEIDIALDKMDTMNGYAIADSIVPLNWASAKFRFDYNETIPVMFTRAELWDITQAARWYDKRLYYKGLDYSKDTSIVRKVKEKFESGSSLDGIKGVTPELGYVYILLCLQRDNYRALEELKKLKLSELEKAKRIKEFQKTLPGRILKTVENAGGAMVRYHRQGVDKIVVVWKLGGQEVNSLLDLDFRVLEAGYCLENEDKKHNLDSIIPLAKIFQEEGGDLYITRE